MYYTYHDSPLGSLLLAGSDTALEVISFPEGHKARRAEPDWIRDADRFQNVREQLDQYFAGERTQFDLDLAPSATRFQRKVLDALLEIPYGETRSYLDIARQIGNPKAVRAVGGANGSNPIPIVIPCHRVVGSNGSLTGFGGGIEAKRFLLALEGSHSGLFAGS